MWRQSRMWQGMCCHNVASGRNVASGGNAASGNAASGHLEMWRHNVSSASGTKVLHHLRVPCERGLRFCFLVIVVILRKNCPKSELQRVRHRLHHTCQRTR